MRCSRCSREGDRVSPLNSVFKKPMVATFVMCVFIVATATGFALTILL